MPPGSAKPSRRGGNIDAIAKYVAVLDDDVALVDADPEFDATLRRRWGIAFGQRSLHLCSAAQCIDDAAELDQEAVPGGLDDAALMAGDLRVDQFGAQRLEPAERP